MNCVYTTALSRAVPPFFKASAEDLTYSDTYLYISTLQVLVEPRVHIPTRPSPKGVFCSQLSQEPNLSPASSLCCGSELRPSRYILVKGSVHRFVSRVEEYNGELDIHCIVIFRLQPLGHVLRRLVIWWSQLVEIRPCTSANDGYGKRQSNQPIIHPPYPSLNTSWLIAWMAWPLENKNKHDILEQKPVVELDRSTL